jgi:hypothetical protein
LARVLHIRNFTAEGAEVAEGEMEGWIDGRLVWDWKKWYRFTPACVIIMGVVSTPATLFHYSIIPFFL